MNKLNKIKKFLCIILTLAAFFTFISCESLYVAETQPIISDIASETEKITDKATEKSTEKAPDKATEKATEKVTEEATETETDGDTAKEPVVLGEKIKVMSYNLKNGSPSAERKENTIKDIADYMPDTIGTQETHLKWINALTESELLSDYALVGEQRYGDEAPRTQNDNEASAILYRKSKFNLIDSGTYWLSETPEKVNSKLEGSKYVRIMTYVVLERKSDGVRFVHINTHLNSPVSNAHTGTLCVCVCMCDI